MGLESTLYNVGYPVYGARFLNNHTLLVTGGGGEGNNGIPNKLTALQVNFQKKKIVKRFRELTLDDNEDSPTTLDVAQDVILMGCNENSEKIRSGGPNHHLRKFVYENEHLKFVGAIDLNRSNDPEDYTKLLYMSQDASVAAIASSVVPTVIRIVNPSNLRETYEVETGNDVKDLHFSSDGKVLAYITSSTLEVISIVTGNFIVRKTDFEKNLSLSKIRFVGENTILIAASLKKNAGIVLTKISLKKGNTSILKTKLVTKKFKSVTSMDVDPKGQLVALAGSDNSVAVIKLKSFTMGKFFKQIHTFAVTRVAFSPDSKLLVSTSAANTIHLVQIPDDFATQTSTLEKLYKLFVNFVLVALLALLMQVSFKHGLPSKAYNIIRKNIFYKDSTDPDSYLNDIFLHQTTLVGDVVSVLPSTKSLSTESASFATDQWLNKGSLHVSGESSRTGEVKQSVIDTYSSGITATDPSVPHSGEEPIQPDHDSLVADGPTEDKKYQNSVSPGNVTSSDSSTLPEETPIPAMSSSQEEWISVKKSSISPVTESTLQYPATMTEENSYGSTESVAEKIYVLDTEEATASSKSFDAGISEPSNEDIGDYVYDPVRDVVEKYSPETDVPKLQSFDSAIGEDFSTDTLSTKSNILDHPGIAPLQSAISALVNNVGSRRRDGGSNSLSTTEEVDLDESESDTIGLESEPSGGLLHDLKDNIIHPRSVLNSFKSLNKKLKEKNEETASNLSATESIKGYSGILSGLPSSVGTESPSLQLSTSTEDLPSSTSLPSLKSYSKEESESEKQSVPTKASSYMENLSVVKELSNSLSSGSTTNLASSKIKDKQLDVKALTKTHRLACVDCDSPDCDSSDCSGSSYGNSAKYQETSISDEKTIVRSEKEIRVSTYTAPPIYRTISQSGRNNVPSRPASSQSSSSSVEVVTVKEIVKETVFVTEKLVETVVPGNNHDEL